MTDSASHPSDDEASPHARRSLGDTLRWSFEFDQSSTLAGATFLTREIIPSARDPFDALIESGPTLHQLEELKNAYKLLRTSGSSAPERSLAARLYAATIATALVRHGAVISSQASATLARAFEELAADASMPERLRDIGALAADALRRAG